MTVADVMSCPSPSTMSIKTASSPFDGTTGDVTLQSSDGIDFHCYSQILVAASPVFEDMVAVGKPTSDPSNPANTRPIVPMMEDSNTLDFLLRFIYPISKPSQPRSLLDIPPLLEASLKYMMEYPTSTLTRELLAFVPNHPMQVWAIGCRLMLEDVARAGAERMLQFKKLGSYMQLQQFVPIEEFVRTTDARGVSAADYYRLWTYHRHHGEVEEGFSFTRPLPCQAQDQLSDRDLNVPWAFFSSEIALPDTTCYGADGKAFPVHAGLLCMSSPVLKENILEERRRVQTLGGDQSHCHIHLTDESPVLAHLLRLCYPGDAPLPDGHHLFLAVLTAAEKYAMVRIVDLLSAKWPLVAGARPASAYFAALKYDFPELTRVAALKVSPTSSTLYVPEMENIPAIYWQRLNDYWAAAEVAVDRVQRLSGGLWRAQPPLSLGTPAPAPLQPAFKGRRKKNQTSYIPAHDRDESAYQARGSTWMQECRNEVLADIRRRLVAQDMPTVEALMRRSVAPTLTEKPWCACCSDVVQDIVRLGTTLRQGMMSELDKVRQSLVESAFRYSCIEGPLAP